MRTAINFQGLDKEAVNRGDVLAHAATLKLSYMLDISLHYLQSNDKPLKNRTVVRCHAGTSEVLGNLILLDREELLPGETTIAQLRLDSPMALIKDDRFVIRSYSPIRTIGGGHIINPIPQKHKRFKDEIIEGLLTLSEQSVEGIITLHASHAGYNGVSFADLRLMTNLPEKKLHQHLQTLLSQRALVQVDKENRIYVHHETFSHLQQEAHRHLSAYHHKFPLKGGMPKEELKSKYPSILTGKIFNLIILQMIKGKELIQEEDTVRLASHKVSLAVGQQDIQDKILNTYHDSKLQPPYFKEITKTLGLEPSQAKDVLMLIVEKGDIIKVKEDLYYHKKPLQKLQQQLIDYLKANGEITTPQFKEMTGASRKFVIPLIEYFDSQKITIRIGDIRKLRKETSG
jgi:selenocysteine-specific elongation factor